MENDQIFRKKKTLGLGAVLGNRIGFHADTDMDPAFFFISMLIRIQGAKTNADSDPGQTSKLKKEKFVHEKYT
jgi:hypothetical protein